MDYSLRLHASFTASQTEIRTAGDLRGLEDFSCLTRAVLLGVGTDW